MAAAISKTLTIAREKLTPLVWPVTVVAAITTIAVYMGQYALDGNKWYFTHDGTQCHMNAAVFYDALIHGKVCPRWAPDLNGGYGYPTFVFYQTGFFFLASPLIWLTNSVNWGIAILIGVLLVAGGIGAYLLARALAANRGVSLFAALMFILTPYIYVNLYVRGDLTEMCATLLAPWPLWALLRVRKAVCNGAAPVVTFGWTLASACLLALVLISHPATSLFLLPAALLWILSMTFFSADPRRDKVCHYTLAAFAICAMLTMWYWVPLVTLKSEVDYHGAVSGSFTAADHSLWPLQLFIYQWTFSGSGKGLDDGMPFPLGLWHFFAAVAGVILAYRNRAVLGACAIYSGLIFFMLHYSNWLWSHIGILSFVQFPWRLLSVTAVFQAICMVGLSRLTTLGRAASIMLLTLILGSTLISLSIIHTCDRYPMEPELREVRISTRTIPGYTLSCTNELMPKTATMKGLCSPRAGLLDGAHFNLHALEGNSQYHLRFAVKREGEQPMLRINQLYFPGWRVLVDGVDVPDDVLSENCAPDGLLKVRMPADFDSHTIEAWYDGPPASRYYIPAEFVSIALIGLLLLYFAHKKSSARAGASRYIP